MKIGYFADGPWSHTTIEMLSKNSNIDLLFIVPRYDTQDPILKQWATDLKIPFIVEPNVNNYKFVEFIKSFNADLFISMSFNQILQSDILSIPPFGFINCHAGKLPFYRGRNPLNWVLINDEKEFGITVHYIDEGIDTGDIIIQDIFQITDHDSYSTLLDKAKLGCALSMEKAINKMINGDVQRIPQNSINPVGTYFGKRTIGDENIDFNWSSRRVFNFIRAISNPGPGARFFLKNQEYAVINAEYIPDAQSYIATVGEVVGVSSKGNIIKVGDSTILLTRICKINDNIKCLEIKPNFPIGTRFLKNN